MTETWIEPSPRMPWKDKTALNTAAYRVKQLGYPHDIAEYLARDLEWWADFGIPLAANGGLWRLAAAINTEYERQARR